MYGVAACPYAAVVTAAVEQYLQGLGAGLGVSLTDVVKDALLGGMGCDVYSVILTPGDRSREQTEEIESRACR